MEEYVIRALDDAPEIRLLYIRNILQTSSWRCALNLNCCKLNLFIEGHSYIIVNGASYAANAGDILLYRPHDVHYGNVPYEQMIEYFELLFEPAALNGLVGGEALIRLFARHEAEDARDAVVLRPDAERLKLLGADFYRLRACLKAPMPHANLSALAILIEILCGINACRAYAAPLKVAPFYPAPLMSALDYVNRHFQERVSNERIGAAASVSPSYLNRLFRQYLHCTPHEYLLSMRLTHAQNCLSQGMSVTQTCYASGFQDSASFAAIFKRAIGVKPSQFARKDGAQ